MRANLRHMVPTKLVPLLALAFILAAPAKKQQNQQQPVDQSLAGNGETPGVLQTIVVNQEGTIGEMWVKQAGSEQVWRIHGCGAKTAEQPLILWLFQNKRLGRFNVTDGCLVNVWVSAPN